MRPDTVGSVASSPRVMAVAAPVRAELKIGHAAVRGRHRALEHRHGRLLARGEGWKSRKAVRPASRRRAGHHMAVGAPALRHRLAAQDILRIGHARQQQHGCREHKLGGNIGGFHDPSTEHRKVSHLPVALI
jgi:hypothetical protein